MNTPDEAHFGQDVYPETERTSLAAIFGFVLSLGGCLGGLTAILGVPLSIVGIVASSRSHGRVGGKGLGIAGLLVGLLMMALWGGCLGGSFFIGSMAMDRMIKPTSNALLSLDQDRLDAARDNFLPPASEVSDEEILAFRAAYRASLGAFQGGPTGLLEWVRMDEVEPLLGAAQGQQQTLPFKGVFENGPALIIVAFDQQFTGVVRITIIDLNGDEYTLPMPPGSDSQESQPDPTDTGSTDPDPADPEEEP